MRVALIVALLLLPVASAQYPGQPGDPDDYDYGDGDSHIENGCIVELDWDKQGSTEVQYTYESICNGLIQDVSYTFRTGSEPLFNLNAEMVGAMQGGGGVHEVWSQLGFKSIVEFRDDGDGKFDPDEDTVVREDKFQGGITDDGWSSISTSSASGNIFFSASYSINWGGTFKIETTTSGATFDAGGITVKPADAKIDFIFQDLEYTDPDTRYALVLHIDAAIESVGSSASRHIQAREEGVQLGGATGMYFTWAKTAKVDGEDKPVRGWDAVESHQESVGGSIYEYEGEGPVTLAYARGSDIVHDPRFGVALAQPADKDSPLPMLPLVGALVALALLRRR